MPTSQVPSDVAFSHADYERLVTGRSLNALEREDDERLSAHLTVCAVCQRSLALLQEVAAELGRSVRSLTPPAGLRKTVCWQAGRKPIPPGQPEPPGSEIPGPGV